MKNCSVLIIVAVLLVAGCSTDDAVAPEEQEELFPAEYWFINNGDGDIVSFPFKWTFLK